MLDAATARRRLRAIDRRLGAAYGDLGWWPARAPFEIIVGAILTQATAWRNVERALACLRRARALAPRPLQRLTARQLERLIRPSGFFRVKARRLRAFVDFLRRTHGGSLRRMWRTPTATLRDQLLSVAGIGSETADAILLYAGGRAVFVVDAYTRRILERHGLARSGEAYERIARRFAAALPRRAARYGAVHAWLVEVAKRHCRTIPQCMGCPLNDVPLADGRRPDERHAR